VKVLTVMGTRPEIIRLSAVVERLDATVDHVLVHTGQNLDPRLHDLFFDDLGVRRPDVQLDIAAPTAGRRMANVLALCDDVLATERPDRVLILGDTDSGLAGFLAKRRGIPVFHMEAGNRCHDERVPEEINRRVIDHSSDVLLPYTNSSRDNLRREGIEAARIRVTGNPILEVMERQRAAIDRSEVLDRLGLAPTGFVIMTAHRQENVDVAERLAQIAEAAAAIAERHGLPVVWPVHPRTADRLASQPALTRRLSAADVRLEAPMGFHDFVHLERAAWCAVTDSGTVQEECCLLGTPTVTIRESTERPETVDCGSNLVTGVEAAAVLAGITTITGRRGRWTPPPEYLRTDVSATVAALLAAATLPGAPAPATRRPGPARHARVGGQYRRDVVDQGDPQ